MTKQEDIRAAEQAVIEAARALDKAPCVPGSSYWSRLHLALCSLDSLRQPPTALDVVERVRGWVRGKNDLDLTGTCDLLNRIERELKEAQP